MHIKFMRLPCEKNFRVSVRSRLFAEVLSIGDLHKSLWKKQIYLWPCLPGNTPVIALNRVPSKVAIRAPEVSGGDLTFSTRHAKKQSPLGKPGGLFWNAAGAALQMWIRPSPSHGPKGAKPCGKPCSCASRPW